MSNQDGIDRGEGLAGFLDLQVGHDQFTTEELIELCGALVKDPQVQSDWSLMFKDFETRFRGLSAELERLRGESNVEHEAAEIRGEELARLRGERDSILRLLQGANVPLDDGLFQAIDRLVSVQPQPQEASEGQEGNRG